MFVGRFQTKKRELEGKKRRRNAKLKQGDGRETCHLLFVQARRSLPERWGRSACGEAGLVLLPGRGRVGVVEGVDGRVGGAEGAGGGAGRPAVVVGHVGGPRVDVRVDRARGHPPEAAAAPAVLRDAPLRALGVVLPPLPARPPRGLQLLHVSLLRLPRDAVAAGRGQGAGGGRGPAGPEDEADARLRALEGGPGEGGAQGARRRTS